MWTTYLNQAIVAAEPVLRVLVLGCAGILVDRFAFGASKTHSSYQFQWRRAAIIVAAIIGGSLL